MKKFFVRFWVFAVMLACMWVLVSCFGGNSSNGGYNADYINGIMSGDRQVPDSFAIMRVGECEHADSDAILTNRVTHNSYDSTSYIDYVTIEARYSGEYGYFVSTCDAAFQYNKSTDLWSLLQMGEWTSPKYTYTSHLVGEWNVPCSNDKDTYIIEVLSVNSSAITLTYDISKMVYGGIYLGDVMMDASGEATVSGNYEGFTFPVDLPNGFYGPGNTRTADLHIRADIVDGLAYAIFYDQINVNASGNLNVVSPIGEWNVWESSMCDDTMILTITESEIIFDMRDYGEKVSVPYEESYDTHYTYLEFTVYGETGWLVLLDEYTLGYCGVNPSDLYQTRTPSGTQFNGNCEWVAHKKGWRTYLPSNTDMEALESICNVSDIEDVKYYLESSLAYVTDTNNTYLVYIESNGDVCYVERLALAHLSKYDPEDIKTEHSFVITDFR